MLSIDATFIFVFISFVIFIFLMKLICYGPITKVIAEREKFYNKNNKTVSDTKSKIQAITDEVNEEISKTKLESSKMLKNANDENIRKKEEEITNKKNEINSSLEEFKFGLNESANAAKNQLKSEVSNYVKTAVSKILDVDYNSIEVDEAKADEVLNK